MVAVGTAGCWMLADMAAAAQADCEVRSVRDAHSKAQVTLD